MSNKENVSIANQPTPPTSSSPIATVAVVKMEVDSDIDTKAVDSNASSAVNIALNATKDDDCPEERYVHLYFLFFPFFILFAVEPILFHKFDCCELNVCNDIFGRRVWLKYLYDLKSFVERLHQYAYEWILIK